MLWASKGAAKVNKHECELQRNVFVAWLFIKYYGSIEKDT